MKGKFGYQRTNESFEYENASCYPFKPINDYSRDDKNISNINEGLFSPISSDDEYSDFKSPDIDANSFMPFPQYDDIPFSKDSIKGLSSRNPDKNPLQAVSDLYTIQNIRNTRDMLKDDEKNCKTCSNKFDTDIVINVDDIEDVLNFIEEENPLIVSSLLSAGISYANMRILLRKVITITFKRYFEKGTY